MLKEAIEDGEEQLNMKALKMRQDAKDSKKRLDSLSGCSFLERQLDRAFHAISMMIITLSIWRLRLFRGWIMMLQSFGLQSRILQKIESQINSVIENSVANISSEETCSNTCKVGS